VGKSEGPELVEPETQEQGPSREYPTATFIDPIEYDWSLDKFITEQAPGRYLEESHADH
jgi:hypothetical protein